MERKKKKGEATWWKPPPTLQGKTPDASGPFGPLARPGPPISRRVGEGATQPTPESTERVGAELQNLHLPPPPLQESGP